MQVDLSFKIERRLHFIRVIRMIRGYLKATGYRLGLLVNFGHFPKLQYERIVR